VRYNTTQFNTIQYNTTQFNTTQYNTIQYIALKSTTLTANTWSILSYAALLSSALYFRPANSSSYLRSRSLPRPQVHIFVGSAWRTGPSVDYMFFRNNTPNEAKLSAQLERSAAQCAYCCQCSWTQTAAERTLSQGVSGDPQWVCAGH
jgi:Retinal Maintenance